jgi:hypothetical protein
VQVGLEATRLTRGLGDDSRMTRRGPHVTLGAAVVLAMIFLWTNTLVAKPGSTAPGAPAASAGAALHALFAGSGDQVTVAIAINGRKAAADLNAGLASEVSLQGSAKGLAVFGMVTPSAGPSFPFSAELFPRAAGVCQVRITVNGLATRVGWAVPPS